MPKPIGRFPRVISFMDEGVPSPHWRIVAPFTRLATVGYPVSVFPISETDKVRMQDVDVLVLYHWNCLNPTALAAFLDDLRRHRIGLVYDTDDDLFNMPTSWLAEADETAVQAHLTRAASTRYLAQAADVVTASTAYLAEQMRVYNPRVQVLPNLIDPTAWALPGGTSAHPPTSRLTVGVHGSPSHLDDWSILAKLFPILAERYPELTFVTAGFCPPYLEDLGLGKRLVKLPWVALDQYKKNVASIDIALCPLPDTPFNRAKSPIKWIESSLCGAAVVASPTVYGEVIRPGETGYIANDLDEWVRYTSMLVENTALRKGIGRRAQRDVLQRHSLANPVELKKRMEVYRMAWERATKTPSEPRGGGHPIPQPVGVT